MTEFYEIIEKRVSKLQGKTVVFASLLLIMISAGKATLFLLSAAGTGCTTAKVLLFIEIIEIAIHTKLLRYNWLVFVPKEAEKFNPSCTRR